MRHFLHLFALLALVTTGLTQGMSMPARHGAPDCVDSCKTSDSAADPCSVISSLAPLGSEAPSCPTLIISCSSRVNLNTFTSAAHKQNHERLERWIEPSPWPSNATGTLVSSAPMDAAPVYLPAIGPSPDRLLERLARLGTFRI